MINSTRNVTKNTRENIREKDYLSTSVMCQVADRIPWLMILMFTSIFTGMIVSHYEEAFKALPSLVALMPMLSDTGGNCGSQSSALVIRGMATHDISMCDFMKVFWKEFRIGFVVGAVLAAANGIRLMIQYHDIRIAVIIAATLILVTVISKLAGACLPMIAKLFHLDPALAASPVLTTVVDICAIWIYFQIATTVMNF